MEAIEDILAASPVFAGLEAEQLALIAGCARTTGFTALEQLFRAGEPADVFYLVRRGRVALQVHDPGRGTVVLETVEAGEVVGWSWLFAPYRWHLDALAVTDVRALVFDAACLRGKCDADHTLGYALMRAFAGVMIDRLQHARTRLLDVYGNHDSR